MLEIFDEAVDAGARRHRAAEVIGVSLRTLQRWRQAGGGEDRRRGPLTPPANALDESERERIREIATSPEHRDRSPKQIVPLLADDGEYVASESSFYRVLRVQGLQRHRGRARAPRRRPRTLVADGPCQVWSWDITYLRSPVRGRFFYLYMMIDVWSRKVVGAVVHECESEVHAAALLDTAARSEGVRVDALTLHADNGGPMKGSTMLAKMQALGVAASFSRPSTSNDNSYSESLFRTVKYRPEYPRGPFADVASARAWVSDFVRWYNQEHLHSGVRFVTPSARHAGRQDTILAGRERVYAAARRRHPERWSGRTRNWSPVETVVLNADGRTVGTPASGAEEAA